MKTLSVANLKANFSAVMNDIRDGEEVAITFGKKKEKVAVLIPYFLYKKKHKRRVGLLDGEAGFSVSDDFKMTDEELLNS